MAQLVVTAAADAYVGQNGDNVTWATLRNGSGNLRVTDPDPNAAVSFLIGAGSTSGRWFAMWRWLGTFNTAALPDDALITSATLSFFGTSPSFHQFSSAPVYHIAGASPASNTTIATSDYPAISRTSFGSRTYANWSTSGWNDIALNASGLANISKTGYSRFSGQFGWDLSDSAPTWSASKLSAVRHRLSGYTGTANDPKITINYVIPPTLVTGAVSSITKNSAEVDGEVTSDGDSTVTERGFVYALTPNPTVVNAKIIVPGTTGTYSGSMTGLSSTTSYYVRTYATNAAGTNYGTQTSFTTLDSNPLQPSNLVPAGGIGTATVTPTLVWKHNPGSGGQSQGAFQLIITRQSDSIQMYDSGKTSSSMQSHVVPIDANLIYGTAYQWKVRTWDTSDLDSPYSSNALFKPSEPPVAIITNPISGLVTSETPLIEWTYTDPESTPQIQYQILLYSSTSALLFSSGLLNGQDLSYQLPAGYLHNGENYTVGVIVKDSDQVQSAETVEDFTVEFIAPSPPTVIGTQTPQGFINLDIELNSPDVDSWNEDYLRIYRKKANSQWQLINSNFPIKSIIIEDFENLDGWVESGQAIAPTAGTAKVGSQSISIGTTGAGDAYYEKTIGLVDWSEMDRLQLWVYTTVSSDFSEIEIKIGQSDLDYYSYIINSDNLVDGSWVCIEIPANDLVLIGSPNRNTPEYLELSILGATSSISAGDILIDQLRAIYSQYEYISYDAEFGEVYLYGVSAYNIDHSVESGITETSSFLIKNHEYLVNTYLIPEESPEQFVGGWMDGNFRPNWSSTTETAYYEPKGSKTPVVFVNGVQRYISGNLELRFFDEKFGGKGLLGAEQLETIKNFKPLILKTWWGRTYRISINGETSTTREPGIGWYVRFDFTEIE